MKEKLLEFAPHLAISVSIALATVITALLLNRYFKRQIKRSAETLHNDPTNYKFLRHAITALIYTVGFSIAIWVIPDLRKLANSLLAGAGILAVAVGFASQQALSNIISGVFIVIFKPFRVNDRITMETQSGIIEDITLRHTVIRDFQNRRIIVPNSIISDRVITNADYEDSIICNWIEIGISYDADIDKARGIMQEEVMAHANWVDNRTDEQKEAGDPPVTCRVITLGDFAVTLRAWAWTKDQADGFVLRCDVTESIKKRYDQEGIEIPFPYRTVVYKKDLEAQEEDHGR